MPRPARRDIAFPGGVYHVYARGNDRMKVFRDAEDYVAYLADLDELMTLYGVVLYHYVLMPNHIHFVLKTIGKGLSAFMKALQCRSAKRFCRKRKFAGHVWQGRFKCKIIDNDAYLLACGNYIEMNPVHAGLVARPEDWPHSSYCVYAYGKRDSLVAPDPFYPNLGATEQKRRQEYRRLVSRTRR